MCKQKKSLVQNEIFGVRKMYKRAKHRVMPTEGEFSLLF